MGKVVNESTPEGFALGYKLAQFVDAEENKAPLPNGRTRCHNCAFRQGSWPNGSPSTIMDALKCAIEGITFLCHDDLQPCAGWVLLRRSNPQAKAKAWWPFSDEITEASAQEAQARSAK